MNHSSIRSSLTATDEGLSLKSMAGESQQTPPILVASNDDTMALMRSAEKRLARQPAVKRVANSHLSKKGPVVEAISELTDQGIGSMAGVATLKVKIDQQLSVSVLPEGKLLDLRGRWDNIRWMHYEALATGIARAIATQLELSRDQVRTDASILVGDGVAEPRLIVEVPSEHKEAVASPKVWDAIQYVIDLVFGAAALDDDGDCSSAISVEASNDPIVDSEVVEANDHPATVEVGTDAVCGPVNVADAGPFDAEMRSRLQSVARKVLAKVGGAMLELPCSIEVEGLSFPPREVSGRCADKPVRRSSGRKQETFDCYVDGFVRSRHTVYLIDVAGNGAAKEVAMESDWERRVAIYASSRYRGRQFRATVDVDRKGDKFVRELINLV